MTDPPGAIVLAAGASSRMGSPKALLQVADRPALARILEVLREIGVEHGAIVLGAEAQLVRAAIDLDPLVSLDNPAPERGRTGSIQIGLEAVREGADFLLWPVDRPLAARETVESLVAAAAGTPEADWFVPHCDGRGHPILLRARVRAAIAAAEPDASLRDLLAASGARRAEVPVDDPFVHANLDTPEVAARLLAEWSKAGG